LAGIKIIADFKKGQNEAQPPPTHHSPDRRQYTPFTVFSPQETSRIFSPHFLIKGKKMLKPAFSIGLKPKTANSLRWQIETLN